MFNKDNYSVNCNKVTLGNAFMTPNTNIDITTSDPENSLVTINGLIPIGDSGVPDPLILDEYLEVSDDNCITKVAPCEITIMDEENDRKFSAQGAGISCANVPATDDQYTLTLVDGLIVDDADKKSVLNATHVLLLDKNDDTRNTITTTGMKVAGKSGDITTAELNCDIGLAIDNTAYQAVVNDHATLQLLNKSTNNRNLQNETMVYLTSDSLADPTYTGFITSVESKHIKAESPEGAGYSSLQWNKLTFTETGFGHADVIISGYSLMTSFLRNETEYRLNAVAITSPTNDSHHSLFEWNTTFNKWIQGVDTGDTIVLTDLADHATNQYDMTLTFLSTAVGGDGWIPSNMPNQTNGMYNNLQMTVYGIADNVISPLSSYTDIPRRCIAASYDTTNTENTSNRTVPGRIPLKDVVFPTLYRYEATNLVHAYEAIIMPPVSRWTYVGTPGTFWININLKHSHMNHRY